MVKIMKQLIKIKRNIQLLRKNSIEKPSKISRKSKEVLKRILFLMKGGKKIKAKKRSLSLNK
jgi:hypothetical protein